MATATSAPDAQASIGTFGRLTGVLFNPKPTFVDIARRPTWLAPGSSVLFAEHCGNRDFHPARGLAQLYGEAVRK
jgi:hypothetical protein